MPLWKQDCADEAACSCLLCSSQSLGTASVKAAQSLICSCCWYCLAHADLFQGKHVEDDEANMGGREGQDLNQI